MEKEGKKKKKKFHLSFKLFLFFWITVEVACSLILLLIYQTIIASYCSFLITILWILLIITNPAEKDWLPFFICSSLGLVYFQSLLYLILWYLITDSNTYCGDSSCSSIIDQSIIAYNPAGQYILGTPFYSTCPTLGCRWADVNLGVTLGYPAMSNNPALANTSAPSCEGVGCLATDRIQDYPNPGLGLRLGYIPGAIDTDLSVCPNIDASIWNGITHGLGQPICSECSYYLYQYYGFPITSGCPPSESDALCFLCVDISIRQTDYMRNSTLVICIFEIIWSIILVIVAVAHAVYIRKGANGGGVPLAVVVGGRRRPLLSNPQSVY